MDGGKLIRKDHNGAKDYRKGLEKFKSDDHGAALLASGSSSCIFHPNIPCKGSDEISNEKISKIIYGSKSDKYLKREKENNSKVKKIQGYNEWALVYDKYCKAPTYSNIFKNYDKEIIDCMDEYYEDKFNDTNNMMIGEFGGQTFEDYFIENILKNKSSKKIDKHMYILLKIMEHLFIGLKTMYNNKLIHLDIKTNNIVFHKDRFKYIDFGLSSSMNDHSALEKRSLSEFNNNRIYLWYPMEYIYSNITSGESIKELLIFNTSKNFKKHYDKCVKIHTLLNNNLQEDINKLLNSKRIEKRKNNKELYTMIDTYSLGILIPFLFVEYNLINRIKKSPFLKDLFLFLEDMCKLEYKNRMKPDECLKSYYKLINKYSSFEKESKKRKKTIKKSKSKSSD